ncbi:hypothetical protein [Andreprevotia chitinilytica]|uniref:hypothetical protein n=1 Tax=Andreprevotia chitinilytica TaxID=396808 RepID=UPI0005592DF7|nr:hypothetical protein [Andreprevotia chitinilytica]
MSLLQSAKIVSLKHIRTSSRRKNRILSLVENIRATHSKYELDLPEGFEEKISIQPLAIAGEQLGVEIRPATIQKIMIMSLLARERGFTPVFLLEDRDVISKADKLTSWLFPSMAPNTKGEFFSRVYFDGIKPNKLKQLPLKFGEISQETAGTSALIRKQYDGAMDTFDLPYGQIGLDDVAAIISECAAQASNIAEYGQRQLFAILKRLGLTNVIFADLGTWEDDMYASGALKELFTDPVRNKLHELGCIPGGSSEYWGVHEGQCHGRVYISADESATCLRCKQSLPPSEWRFFSLRAIPRMFAIASLGVDLFVTGGTSEYNDLVYRLFQSLDEPMFPLIWKSGFDYQGPFQQKSEAAASVARQGKYTFLDAIIASSYATAVDEQRKNKDAIGAADQGIYARKNILSRAYQSLSDSMLAQIMEHGVHWAEEGEFQ